jgi:hypothetical protein
MMKSADAAEVDASTAEPIIAVVQASLCIPLPPYLPNAVDLDTTVSCAQPLSMLESLLSGMVGGAVTWLVAQWFVRHYVRFVAARERVLHALFYYANVGYYQASQDRQEAAKDELRACAADIYAVRHSASTVVLWILRREGYDLDKGISGLTGLSNSIHDLDGSRAHHKKLIETSLRLPA